MAAENKSRILALAVIAQAVADFEKPSLDKLGRVAKDEARKLLLESKGAWAGSRKAWCETAEISETQLIKRAQCIQNSTA